ncbi:hypothetical protein Pfo_027201 [Paulownia fortunei]|nr:hypothetical protein Pfo_027201 [Paulownia fortunei]
MIKEKIFRLHRHKSSSSAGTDASGQKFDFTFSNIKALQVPKGWDKVSLSLISSESGKTVRKSGKVPVKNGTCQWTETLSQSIWITDVDSSKELEEYLFKFLVASGSSRSGILGETTLNLAAFLSSESPILVSLPLKKCNYRTILQVEVKCLTPKTNHREEKWKEMHAHKDENADHDDMENRSEISDSTIMKSIESCSSNNGNSSRPRELGSRETSFSASVSRYSFDSMDDSVGRQSFSSQSDRNGGNNVIGRQDSIESNDSASYCSYYTHGSIKSVRSLQGPFTRENQGKNQREEFRKSSHATAPSLQQNGSSKTFKEANDATVQQLEAEARMWEQNARKLAVDMESLRTELSDQNLNMTNLNMELATSRSECHKLTQEIEHLKFLLEESKVKKNVGQDSELQETARSNTQKELEDEIRFQKEANENFSLQLKKTQESNIELISFLQEMEETIEKQKLEIESLSANKLEFIYTNEKNRCRHEDCSEVKVNDQVSANDSKSLHDCDLNTSISEMSVADTQEQIPRENNCSLEHEEPNLQELQQTLQGDIVVLESTLEDKIIETEIEQDLKNQILKECVVECNHRLAAKEQKIMSLEAALSRGLSDENLEKFENRGHVDVSKEIGQLKEKVRELETDCDELTEENLELLFEIKELRKNVSKVSNACLVSSSHDVSVNGSHHASTSEVSNLDSCMQQPMEEREKNEFLHEGVADLEGESKNLDFLSQSFTGKDCNLDLELQKCHEKAEEQKAEIVELQKQLASKQGSNNGSTPEDVFKLGTTRHVDELLPALLEQLQFFLVSIENKESDILLPHLNGSKDAIFSTDVLESIDSSTQTERVNAVLDKIVLSLQAKLTGYENNAQSIEENTRRDDQKNVCECQNRRVCVSLEESTPCSHVEPGKSSNDEPNFNVQSPSKEFKSVMIEPNADSLMKEKDIEAQSYHKSDLKLQDNMERIERDGIIISDCSSNSVSDMILLSSSIGSHVSDYKIHEMRLMEPENDQTELVKHLSDLQEENIYLSQRVSGLEAQLRYLTDTRESCRLELQHSESQVKILQNQIRILEEQIESQKLDMKHKLLEMQKRWSEAQEECTSLSKLNVRLQATTENLIEECNSLQKFNEELREQKLKLQNHCMVLEAEARKFRDSRCNCAENIGTLEVKYSLLKEEITAKGKALDSKLDAFNVQKKAYENKLLPEKHLLNQRYVEKAEEAANLELKVAYVSGQVSATYVETEWRSLGAEAEKHYGYEGKNELESTLDGVQENIERSERENKVVLLANQEKLLKLFENIMNDESKSKSIIDELESKIKLSELERLQLAEENSVLRMQLQKVPELQNEVLALRVSLKEMKSQTQLLEASFKSVSGDYEELKCENISMVEKISSMQKAVSEAEDCKRKKNALEEKILRLEGDLIARDALCVQDAEMKNELNHIKIANSQFVMKVKHLEDVREDLQSRVQSLEEELKRTRHAEENYRKSTSEFWPPHFHPLDTNTAKRSKLSKDHCVSADQSKLSIHPPQSCEYLMIQDNQGLVQQQFQFFNKQVSHSRRTQVSGMDYESRIQLLENELVKALKVNDMYKSQLESARAVASKKSESKDTIDTAKTEYKISLLEAELQEIRDRYLQISLKYAEVEVQREQLVMKLKALNS